MWDEEQGHTRDFLITLNVSEDDKETGKSDITLLREDIDEMKEEMEIIKQLYSCILESIHEAKTSYPEELFDVPDVPDDLVIPPEYVDVTEDY